MCSNPAKTESVEEGTEGYGGVYTSLYQTLQPNHIVALEEAILAFTLGRFDDAEAIFESRLPPSHTSPVIALERCRGYDIQGLPFKKVGLLKKALEQNEGSVRHERWLMRLVLCHSEAMAYGTLRNALMETREVRKFLGDLPLSEYSDIDVSLVNMYHLILTLCRGFSNWVIETADSTFPAVAELGPWRSISQLRVVLQQHGRFSEAKRLMLAEARFCSWFSLRNDHDQICDAMERKGNAISKVYAALSRISIAEELMAEGKTNEAKIEIAKAMRLRGDLEKDFGQDGIKHLDHRIDVASFKIDPPDSAEERRVQSRKFADTARELKDYGMERLHLLGAIQHAKAARDTMGNASSRAGVLDAVSRLLDFEAETSQCAFVLASALTDIGIEFERSQQQSEFMEHLADFQARFPEFDIPLLRWNFLHYGATAAQELGDFTPSKRYEDAARAAYSEYPSVVVGADGVATTDPTSESIGEAFLSEDPSSWRKVAVKIVIGWVKVELARGFITNEQARELLGMTGDSTFQRLTSSNPAMSDAIDAIDPEELAGELFGILKPTPPEIWNPRFNHIQEWLQKDGPPSVQMRHGLLDVLQNLRILSYHDYAMAQDKQDYETSKCIASEKRKRLALNPVATSGATRVHDCRVEVASSIVGLSFTPQAIADKVITDEMVVESISMLEDSLSWHKSRGNLKPIYFALNRLSNCMWQRYRVFKNPSIPPTAALPYLVEADEILCEIRRERSISKSSIAFGAKQNLAETLMSHSVYGNALRITLEACFAWKPGQHSMVSVQTCNGDSLDEYFFEFLGWTQKSKARGLTDILGLGARIPAGMLVEAEQSSSASSLLEVEYQLVSYLESVGFEQKLHIRQRLRDLREVMRNEPALDAIMRIRDGTSITLAEIQELGAELGPDVVFVDWVHVKWRDNFDLLMVLYRNGRFQQEVTLSLKLEDVERWVHEYLDVDDPLNNPDANNQLSAMAGLIAPLEHCTAPGDTLVLIPTQILHRVPLHAIRLGDQPLIVRNPVLYTQSLSVLRLCAMYQQRDPAPVIQPDTHTLSRAVVLFPLPDSCDPESDIEDLATRLHTTPLRGPRIERSSVLNAVANASLLHYHGHVLSSDDQPLQRSLILDGESKIVSEGTSITTDTIFDVSLIKPALVTLIGCFSNQSVVNQTDDLRGMPTAFHYAGASSVVSTLWPILNSDGMKFSNLFYGELETQMEHRTDNASSVGLGQQTLDLAKAIQEAVKEMMKDEVTGEESKAYHWAAFVLNGLWRWPVPRGVFGA